MTSIDTQHDRPQPALALQNLARPPRLLFLVSEDWYFVSHRLALAVAAREAGYDVHVATRVDEHAATIEDAGLKLLPISFDRSGLGPLGEARTLAQLIRLYRKIRPDIAHHVALKPVVYGTLAARLAGTSAIVNALGGLGYVFSSDEPRARLLRTIAGPALRFALRPPNVRVILQNPDHVERLIETGFVRRSQVDLIRGAGVDPARYRTARSTSQPPLVILPARLLRDKGVREFVAAAHELADRGVEARFALVGDRDPANPACVSLEDIDDWKQKGVVEFWGWRDDMPETMAQAQIVCLPSYHEGLPRALLEAAASGCAMISTDIPGSREIVRDGETGWLVPPRDTTALASALHDAIEHPEKRRTFGEAGRALLCREFSLDRVISDTLAIYARMRT